MSECLSPGVYIEEFEMGAKPIEGVSTSTAGFVGVTDKKEYKDKATFVSSWGDFVSKFGQYTAAAPYMAPAVYSFFANGGKRCYIVCVDKSDDASLKGTDGGPGKRTGLQAFNEIDEISIVAAPGITSEVVQKALITHCETLKDRFCILDSKQGDDLTKVQAQKDKLTSDKGYGALYYPWIKMGIEKVGVGGKIELENMFIPPSGAIAGIYARSDTERGVHKAPANEVVRNVTELEFAITTAEQDILNPKGINCIRAFSGRGIRVWGARTISSDASWKYVNIRRLFLYLEESIDESTQWVVFEPNDQKLWARVAQTVGSCELKSSKIA